jgi:hypothetical protein
MPVVCLPRPDAPIPAPIRPAVWAIALGLAVALAACSDDEGRRDQFYGTDVGANYQLPDGFLDRTPDTSGGDAREAAVLDAAPGDDAPSGGGTDAEAFQDAGEAADAETGG